MRVSRCLLLLVLLITTVILAVLTAGCATYRTGRWVTIETHRVEVASPESGDLSDALAVDLFRNVAGKIGFAVKGPIEDPRTPQMFEYAAETPGPGPVDGIWLHLMANRHRIIFSSEIYGTAGDFVRAGTAATLFTQVLDQHGVKYRVRKGRDPLFWGP